MPNRNSALADFMREQAWETAIHERDQRDQVTQKIRFGLVVLNGASLATVLGSSSLFDNLPHGILAFAATCFALGIVAAGWALESHQTHLIASTGRWSSNAMKRDQLNSMIEFSLGAPDDLETRARIDNLLSALSEETKELFAPDATSNWRQHSSSGLWVAGMLSIIGYKLFSLM